MKTYLNELRGQVKGNARLRRRLDVREHEIRRLRGHIQNLVTMLDKCGHGDHYAVVNAARAAGWVRWSQSTREQILAEIAKVFGVKL